MQLHNQFPQRSSQMGCFNWFYISRLSASSIKKLYNRKVPTLRSSYKRIRRVELLFLDSKKTVSEQINLCSGRLCRTIILHHFIVEKFYKPRRKIMEDVKWEKNLKNIALNERKTVKWIFDSFAMISIIFYFSKEEVIFLQKLTESENSYSYV